MDLNKWKHRLEKNIVTKEMIDTMYIKSKITADEYLFITGLDEIELEQEDPSEAINVANLHLMIKELQDQLNYQDEVIAELFMEAYVKDGY